MWQKLVTLMSCLRVDAVLFHTGISVSYLLQSSLLMSILRELPITKGSVKVQGKISYTSQQPWVFSASLRQNIVFGNKFDSARYNKIIRACALDKVCINQPMLNNTVYFLGMLYSLMMQFNLFRVRFYFHDSILLPHTCKINQVDIQHNDGNM